MTLSWQRIYYTFPGVCHKYNRDCFQQKINKYESVKALEGQKAHSSVFPQSSLTAKGCQPDEITCLQPEGDLSHESQFLIYLSKPGELMAVNDHMSTCSFIGALP